MYQKSAVLILITLLGISACKQEKFTHLPKEKMEKVLLDVQLAEVYGTMAGYDTVQKIPIKSNDSLVVFYREVLDHHHITLQEFIQSLDWYRHHPDVLDTVYRHSMNILTVDARQLDKEKDTARHTEIQKQPS